MLCSLFWIGAAKYEEIGAEASYEDLKKTKCKVG